MMIVVMILPIFLFFSSLILSDVLFLNNEPNFLLKASIGVISFSCFSFGLGISLFFKSSSSPNPFGYGESFGFFILNPH